METKDHKKHRKKHSGPKAEKKKKRHLQDLQLGDEEDARKRNPKAFAVQSAVRMARSFHRCVYLGLVGLPLSTGSLSQMAFAL
jgi:ribosome biogenesis protein BMS1